MFFVQQLYQNPSITTLNQWVIFSEQTLNRIALLHPLILQSVDLAIKRLQSILHSLKILETER
jgi:hypothetical protein